MSIQYINSSGESKALFLRPQHATAFSSYSMWFLGVALYWTAQVQQMHQEHWPVLRVLCSCPPYPVVFGHLSLKMFTVVWGWRGSICWVTGQSRHIISFLKVWCFLSQKICLIDDEMGGLGWNMSLLLRMCWLSLSHSPTGGLRNAAESMISSLVQRMRKCWP